jgi:hypothetical protein
MNRYEELVADPEKSMRNVIGKIGKTTVIFLPIIIKMHTMR